MVSFILEWKLMYSPPRLFILSVSDISYVATFILYFKINLNLISLSYVLQHFPFLTSTSSNLARDECFLSSRLDGNIIRMKNVLLFCCLSGLPNCAKAVCGGGLQQLEWQGHTKDREQAKVEKKKKEMEEGVSSPAKTPKEKEARGDKNEETRVIEEM